MQRYASYIIYVTFYFLSANYTLFNSGLSVFLWKELIIESTDINHVAGEQASRKLVASSLSSKLSDSINWTSRLLQCSVIAATNSANVPYRCVNIHHPSCNQDNVRCITITINASRRFMHSCSCFCIFTGTVCSSWKSSVTVCITWRLDVVGLSSCQENRHQSDIRA